MLAQSYLENKNAIYRSIVRSTFSDNAIRHSLPYNIASASLSNFSPGIAQQQHLSLYKHVLYHQQLSVLDESYPQRIHDMMVEPKDNEIIRELRAQPSIIVTFHTGAYRLLNLWLLHHQIPFSLVLASEVLNQQGDHFKSIVKTSSPNNQQLDCIDAERPTAALQMLRTLRSGKSLVVYIDGNTGVATASDHLSPVSFLNGRILIRKGISVIAHMSGCPIHCLATYYDDTDKLILKYFGRITTDKDELRENFVKRSLQSLYDQLALIVKRYPAQWEGWLYLHKSAILTRADTALQFMNYNDIPLCNDFYTLNSNEFSIFIADEQYFLLHKRSYTFYLIDRCLFNCLSQDRFSAMAMPAAQSIVTELLASGVITPACLPV